MATHLLHDSSLHLRIGKINVVAGLKNYLCAYVELFLFFKHLKNIFLECPS